MFVARLTFPLEKQKLKTPEGVFLNVFWKEIQDAGKKLFQEKLFNHFLLSEGVPRENFYRRLKELLSLDFLYYRADGMYGETGDPSIDPVVFFKIMLVGYLENITCNRRLMVHCILRINILYLFNYDIEEELPWHNTVSRTRQLFKCKLFEESYVRFAKSVLEYPL